MFMKEMIRRIKPFIIILLAISSGSNALYASPQTYSINSYTLLIKSNSDTPYANSEIIYNLKIFSSLQDGLEKPVKLTLYVYMENMHAGHNMPGMNAGNAVLNQMSTDFISKSESEYEAKIIFPMEGEWKIKVSGMIDKTHINYIFSNTVLPTMPTNNDMHEEIKEDMDEGDHSSEDTKKHIVQNDRNWINNGVFLAAIVVIFFAVSMEKQNKKLKGRE